MSPSGPGPRGPRVPREGSRGPAPVRARHRVGAEVGFGGVRRRHRAADGGHRAPAQSGAACLDGRRARHRGRRGLDPPRRVSRDGARAAGQVPAVAAARSPVLRHGRALAGRTQHRVSDGGLGPQAGALGAAARRTDSEARLGRRRRALSVLVPRRPHDRLLRAAACGASTSAADRSRRSASPETGLAAPGGLPARSCSPRSLAQDCRGYRLPAAHRPRRQHSILPAATSRISSPCSCPTGAILFSWRETRTLKRR